MLKLSPPTENYWLDLGSGVSVKVKPCTSLVWSYARSYMSAEIKKLASSYHDIKKAGGKIDAFPDLEDPIQCQAVSENLFIKGLAHAALIEWDGIIDNDSDKVAPVTFDKIDELFDNFCVITENFYSQYSGVRELLDAEKNALRLASNGTLGAGQTIAKTVKPARPTVQKAK